MNFPEGQPLPPAASRLGDSVSDAIATRSAQLADCDFPTDAYLGVIEAAQARAAHRVCDPATCTTLLRANQILRAATEMLFPARPQ
ncbi:hypothetical protein ABZ319_31925 [Nocardia sp. NPDC005978]|uniref:hypothetical protein n=1 Tax=Nocardia sp. NPDC005978 TaxID=3156725 RepID=UPI0033AF29AF